MRGFKAFAFAATASVLLAGSLQAQTATGSMKWIGVNGTTGKYSVTGVGNYTSYVYTSPYRAQFQIPTNPNPVLLPPAGTIGFGSTWDIYCVDFKHYANQGTSNVFFTNLADARTDNTLLGKYTRNTTLVKYLAAAYLAEQIRATPSNAGILNGAIWQIMSGEPNYWWNGSEWKSVTETANYALNIGSTNVNASNWVVVTEGTQNANGVVTLGAGQEYITQVTPEPATMLLLGTGLVVMLMAAGALRRPVA